MGRPNKQTVDYFPHMVGGSRKTIFLLEDAWNNDGYAFWFKLLELLCASDGHYYDVSSVASIKYLCAYTKVNEETALEILNTLADLENIDPELWRERKIIWCQALVDNVKGVYSKRTTSIPHKPFSEDNLPEKEEKTDENTAKKVRKASKKPSSEKKVTKKDDKKPTAPKKHYAEFVELTEAEYQKLVEKYGAENTRLMIEKLDNAKGAKGYKYKSDYRAILSWVAEEIMKGQVYGETRRPTQPQQPGGFKPSGGFKK